VKLAVVVQRYGADINGGAELHARYIAERLARHHHVEVLTTCARNYVTWANELPAGTDTVNGVAVRRFPVRHERDVHEFARRQAQVFDRTHSLQDELAWLESEGPTSPALLRHIEARSAAYDAFLFFSYRYWHAWHGARAVGGRAVLVPTAERDPAIALALFPPIFRGVRAIMFNSLEERAMIEHVAGQPAPGVVVGVGSEIPEHADGERFRTRFGITGPFALYVGRIDENKGCTELFDFFLKYARRMPGELDLVLIGTSILPVPEHRRIRHLGFLPDQDKFDALAAADLLVMPSYYESLSMVTLEAWALGKPVLVNGRCNVLRGQSVRSRAGLYYENYGEFAEALYALVSSPTLKTAMGENGRAYFRANYTWPVIEQKYLDVLDSLAAPAGTGQGASAAARPIEPLPNFFARRRRILPPASEVLASVPDGAVVS
jgi:glycosyltransferase involved in cell wall biosynthesis